MACVIDLCERYPHRISPERAQRRTHEGRRVPVGYTILAAMAVSGAVWTGIFAGAAALVSG